jgi:Flp pilus assembly pilin Flp
MLTSLTQLTLSLAARAKILREDGQALVEYTLILALISVVAILVLTNIGADVLTKLEAVEKAF